MRRWRVLLGAALAAILVAAVAAQAARAQSPSPSATPQPSPSGSPQPSPSGSPQPSPSGSPQPSPSGSPQPSPSPSAPPQAVTLLNPSTDLAAAAVATPVPVNDRYDGVDSIYRIVALVGEDVPNEVLEAYFAPDGGTEITLGLMDPVPGRPDLWELRWDIPEDLPGGPGRLIVRLFGSTSEGLTEVANDEVAVELTHSDPPPPDPPHSPAAQEAAALTWPLQGGSIGFYRPHVGAWRAVVDGSVSAVATHAQIFYSVTPQGVKPDFKSCAVFEILVRAPDGTAPFRTTCTLPVKDLPSKVTAIAAVPQIRSGSVAIPGASDAVGVTPYLQDPTAMTIVPRDEILRGTAGATCLNFHLVVTDGLGRPVQGANVDFHVRGPDDQVSIFGGVPPQSGSHHIETVERCPPLTPVDPATGDQGRHRIPGGLDIKHIETGPGSGLTLPTTPPGEVRFPVFSKTKGLTEITAWIDDEDLVSEVEQRPPDNDTQEPDEPHFEFLAQWFQGLPRITMDPPGGTGPVTGCVPFTLKVRTGPDPVPRINVDVHATGPGDDIAFCTPPSGAEMRPPDDEDSGHDPPATHTSAEDADTRHIEGETDDAGNLVVGLSSASGGDTTLGAWIDGEVGKDNDVQDGSESVSSGRAVSAAVSWSASPADTNISFLNPSPYGASGTTGAGSGTQLPDAGGTTRIMTRVDSPDIVAGVEVLLSSDGKNTFQTLGRAERIGTTDVYALEWPVVHNDGSYALRARVIGMPEVSVDIGVTVGAGSVASAPNPALETVRVTHPLAGGFAQFRGASTDIDGIASAGAEGIDLFYTKVPAKDTPKAAEWLFCGYADLNGAGTTPQRFSATCTLQGADQPHQVTGVAAITYDCAVAGCDANPNPPPPPQPPSPLPGVTLSRAPGQKDTGDSVRVVGVEAQPLIAIEPAEAEDYIGACRRVEVALEDQTGQIIPDANIDFHLSGPVGTAFCDPGDASSWRLPDEGDHQVSGEPGEPPSDAYHDELGAQVHHIETETLRGGPLVLGITATETGDALLSAWVDRDDDDVHAGDEPSDQMTMHWVTVRGCTIVGTEDSDVLHGTPGKDRICGLGGDDVIYGFDGADVIFGGPGNDTLMGGKGRDLLRGGTGADVLRGGPGNDRCRGGPGRDEITSCGPRTRGGARVPL